MITGQYWKLHDDAEIRRIESAAFRLLTHAGARIRHDGLLKMLEAAGCRITWSEQRCFFTERLIRDVVERLGGQATMDVQIPPGWNPRWRMRHAGSHPHLLLWPGGQRRLATTADVIAMAKTAHTLEEFEVLGKVLTCSDIDQRLEPMWFTVQAAQITDKPIADGEVFFGETVEWLIRMGEVLSGKSRDTRLVPACDFWIQPLILDPNQAECFIAKRRAGIANYPGTMAVAGMSSPVTIAGTVALSLAELLAGWVLGYVVNPEVRSVGGIVATGSLDMRTMTACFASPEALLQNVSTANIARRLYGISVLPITSYTDCKRPGLEAAFQKMSGLLLAPFGPHRGIGTDGLLSAGQDYCPVQHILDHEMNNAISRFWGHYEISDETLAVDVIEQSMRADQTNLLESDHTLAHYQKEQWYPRWLDRTRWQTQSYEVEAEANMLTRIAHYCTDAIARYQPPTLDQSKLRELKAIYACAEKAILT